MLTFHYGFPPPHTSGFNSAQGGAKTVANLHLNPTSIQVHFAYVGEKISGALECN